MAPVTSESLGRLSLGINYLRAFTWMFLLLLAQLIRQGFLNVFGNTSHGSHWYNVEVTSLSLGSLTLHVALLVAIISVVLRYLIFSPWPIYQRAFKTKLKEGLSSVTLLDIVISSIYFIILFIVAYFAVQSVTHFGLVFFVLLALPKLDTYMVLIMFGAKLLFLVAEILSRLPLYCRRLASYIWKTFSAHIQHHKDTLNSQPREWQRLQNEFQARLQQATKELQGLPSFPPIVFLSEAFVTQQRFILANIIDFVLISMAGMVVFGFDVKSVVMDFLRLQYFFNWPEFVAQVKALDAGGSELGWLLVACSTGASLLNIIFFRSVYAEMFRVLFQRKRVEEDWLKQERVVEFKT